jgi:hypothetical protein
VERLRLRRILRWPTKEFKFPGPQSPRPLPPRRTQPLQPASPLPLPRTRIKGGCGSRCTSRWTAEEIEAPSPLAQGIVAAVATTAKAMTGRARRLAGVRGERRRVRWCAVEREGSEKRDGER